MRAETFGDVSMSAQKTDRTRGGRLVGNQVDGPGTYRVMFKLED